MLARQQSTPHYDPVQLIGTVRQVNGALFTITCDGVDWVCPRALSCLIEPQAGDQVLISGPDHDRVYLIALIARSSDTPVALKVHGDLNISSTAGSVSLHSATNTRISSDASLALRSAHYEQTHDTARLTVKKMSYASETLEATVGTSTFFSSIVNLMADRINSVARLCFRHVKEVDHVRAQTIDYEADKLTRVHGGYTTLTAQDVMKINGDQIHMS